MADKWPKGHISQWGQLIEQARIESDDRFDFMLDADIQTDKELIKIIPCPECKRPLVVTTFYVMAWAMCWKCRGDTRGERATASVGQPQAGRTHPRLARDLNKVLLNKGFSDEDTPCPAHQDDPEHRMELKSVSWSKNYGPFEWHMVDGRPQQIQVAPGETALLQCVKCNATITYSTTAVTQFRRQNEVHVDAKHMNGWADTLGTRDENLETWIGKQDDFEEPDPEGAVDT